MPQPLTFFIPLARKFSTLASPAFMPSTTAAPFSGERFLNSKVLPGSMPILASLARISLSSGDGGTNWRANAK